MSSILYGPPVEWCVEHEQFEEISACKTDWGNRPTEWPYQHDIDTYDD